MSELEVQVPEELQGERVDLVLAQLMGLSRSKVADYADQGLVRLGNRVVNRSAKVAAGDWLTVLVPPERNPLEVVPEFIEDMRVLYDDSDVVVIDKPAGVAVHPSAGFEGPTVVGGLVALGYRITTQGAAERQGVVQRLDVGTSGVMVIAKSDWAYSHLKQQFRDRTVDKIYHALVHGRLDPMVGTIDAPIGRHPNHDWKFAVMEGGRPSVTHYETIEAMAYASLLEIHLETGRTHQIRVHALHMGHALAGDERYGDEATNRRFRQSGLKRLFLHAAHTTFRHPRSGEALRIEAPLDQELAVFLEGLPG